MLQVTPHQQPQQERVISNILVYTASNTSLPFQACCYTAASHQRNHHCVLVIPPIQFVAPVMLIADDDVDQQSVAPGHRQQL